MQAALNEQQEHNDALMSRIQRLEQTVADERTQQTALTQQLDVAVRQAHRVGEVESRIG